MVVKNIEVWLVVAAGEPFLGNRHTNTGGNSLSERTGGGLDTRDPVILWMPGRLAVELAKMANIVQRDSGVPQSFVICVHRLDSRQVQRGPKQHRRVAIRQHETIAVGPNRVLWIKSHNAVPDRVNQGRERHRGAGMPGLGLLHSVDRKRANGVYRQLV